MIRPTHARDLPAYRATVAHLRRLPLGVASASPLPEPLREWSQAFAQHCVLEYNRRRCGVPCPCCGARHHEHELGPACLRCGRPWFPALPARATARLGGRDHLCPCAKCGHRFSWDAGTGSVFDVRCPQCSEFVHRRAERAERRTTLRQRREQQDETRAFSAAGALALGIDDMEV